MVEGGVVKPDKSEFTECWRVIWKTPYIMQLALSAGIGGFLFGYDTGVISGALLYIKEDFEAVDNSTFLQEVIVSTCVAGAIIGAAFGGYFNDRFGRKKTIICADILFLIGAIVMAAAPAPWVIILGRIFVGLGVGMASMTAPLYISEASPARIRGALVSTNGLLITGGQFSSYLINIAFTKNRVEEAKAILARIYPADELEHELNALKESVESEKEMEESTGKDIVSKVKGALGDPVVCRGLYAGITVQVAQQFVGINTVMYYAPTIVQFAGYASNSVALALSLITSGLNAIGSIVSMLFVDRYGRRRLMIISIIGIILCLVALAAVFQQASTHAPVIGQLESSHFGSNLTCPAYLSSTNKGRWNCMDCLKAKCAFCTGGSNKFHPGACLVSNKDLRSECRAESHIWFAEGCPSKIGFVAVIFLALYIILYAPGMGTVPWIVNAEIYPLRYRGIGGGMAAMANWTSNLFMTITFLTFTELLTVGGAFLLYAGFSVIGLIAIYFLVPETKGLAFEEVETMLKTGYKPKFFKKQAKGPGSA